MATLRVCVVKDRALDLFGRPFFVPSMGVAERSFKDEVNNKEGEMYKHPEDYDLYSLGVYHEETGAFECEPPKLLMRAQDVQQF